MASDDWVGHMGVDKLARGKNQPFYEVFAVDGTVRCEVFIFILLRDINMCIKRCC